MKQVAVFLSDETTARRLAVGFKNRCAVVRFGNLESAKPILESGEILAVVVDMRRRSRGRSPGMTELIMQLRSNWPRVPVIGYVNFTPRRVRDILAAGQAGITDIALSDFDDNAVIATRILDIGASSEIAARVVKAIDGIVPPQLHEFCESCILNARYSMTVAEIITHIQRSRKTISRWLALSELPPPAHWAVWGRVLVAARMLEDNSRSPEAVALELQFRTSATLRKMLRRYLGCGLQTLQERGGFEYALNMFLCGLSVPNVVLPALLP